jgi:hypothetical protein
MRDFIKAIDWQFVNIILFLIMLPLLVIGYALFLAFVLLPAVGPIATAILGIVGAAILVLAAVNTVLGL